MKVKESNKRTVKSRGIGLFFLLFGTSLLVAIDQITKIVAQKQLMEQGSILIIPKILQFNYLENRGAAFGILQDSRTFFLMITIVVACIAIFIAWKLLADSKFNLLVINLSIFLAGAFGNFIDRLVRHYVIDFFEFKFIKFPVFNVADIYVTISFVFFLILLFIVYKEEDFEGLFSKKKSKVVENKENNE